MGATKDSCARMDLQLISIIEKTPATAAKLNSDFFAEFRKAEFIVASVAGTTGALVARELTEVNKIVKSDSWLSP